MRWRICCRSYGFDDSANQKGLCMNRSWMVISACALTLVTACGQKASTRTTAVTPAPVVSGPLHPGQNAMLASSPSDVHCGAKPPVWANSHSMVYHVEGDPYYGHTKYGGYICEKDAVRAGYRISKTPVTTEK
jgi:hypothetical protein